MGDPIPQLKHCGMCRQDLPLEAFNRHRGNGDGRATRCRSCDSAYKKAWYLKNRERQRERDRQLYQGEYRERAIARARARYERDPAKWNADQHARRWRDPEAARAKERAYRAANRERVKKWKRDDYERNGAKTRAKHAEWYAADPEKFIGRVIEWQRRNPDLVRLKVGRYKARKLAATVGEVTPDGLIGKLAYWGWACHLCSGKHGEVTDWDHVKPLARGGAHMLANLRPACDHCNSRKKAQWPYPVTYYPFKEPAMSDIPIDTPGRSQSDARNEEAAKDAGPAPAGDGLDDLTKDELLQEAEARGVEVKTSATKQEILDALRA